MMTLNEVKWKIREDELRKEARICTVIQNLRGAEISDNQILEMLQDKERLSRRCAEYYIEIAEEVVREIDEHSAFMYKLCKLIYELREHNAEDTNIQLKIQEEFGFNEFEAEFFLDYVTNSKDVRRLYYDNGKP